MCGVAGDGFEDVIGGAIDCGAEEFVVGAPANAKFSGARPGLLVCEVWGGCGGYVG